MYEVRKGERDGRYVRGKVHKIRTKSNSEKVRCFAVFDTRERNGERCMQQVEIEIMVVLHRKREEEKSAEKLVLCLSRCSQVILLD